MEGLVHASPPLGKVTKDDSNLNSTEFADG
jgi:hypothetical protein